MEIIYSGKLKQSETDSLTGLANIDGFRRVAELTFRTLGDHSACALLFLNITDFKLYNERKGHTGGDDLLKFMAETLRSAFPDGLVARMAGDHFLVLTQRYDYERRIVQLQGKIREYAGHSLGTKVGVYYPKKGEEVLLAVDRAKLASDSVKNIYGDVCKVYDSSLSHALAFRNYLTDHLDEAISREWLKVYYQPIVRINNGRLSNLEALCRWEDPDYGMMTPAVFIPVLEEARLIWKLDAYMVQKVTEELADRKANGAAVVPVNINLSRHDFDLKQCDIFYIVDRAVKEHDLQPRDINIEITESALAENGDDMLRTMNLFRQSGYRLWLDDFGCGYSSFNVLSNFEFDVLKIDMNFLQRMEEKNDRKKAELIIFTIIRMAKELGIHTVCEGIETGERLNLLRSLGCNKAQGHYYSRPLPLTELNLEKYQLEDWDERVYQDQVDLINVIDSDEAGEHGVNHSRPAVLTEIFRNQCQLLSFNKAFLDYMSNYGHKSGNLIESWVNSSNSMAQHIRETAGICYKTRQAQYIDYIRNGRYGTAKFDFIAENKARGSYTVMVTVEHLNLSAERSDAVFRDAGLRNLLSVYHYVEILNMERNEARMIYHGSPLYSDMKDISSTSDFLWQYADRYIKEEDRARYLKYYTVADLEKFFTKKEYGYRISWFRTRKTDGYYWMAYIQVSFLYDGCWYILTAARDVSDAEYLKRAEDIGFFESSLGYDNTPTSHHSYSKVLQGLLDGTSDATQILNLLSVGIFWKDKKRRFVGVNDYFLNYYGFSSTSEILGKTDEEVGWHVQPLGFKQDEEAVLRDGIKVNGAVGNCIRKGENRTIMAFKRPMIIDGKIEGLIGYFLDVTNIKGDSEPVQEYDEQTGLLNESGLRRMLPSYAEEFATGGKDFVQIELILNNLSENQETAMKDIMRIATVLRRNTGVDSLLAMTEPGHFCILHQFRDKAEVTSLIRQISSSMAITLNDTNAVFITSHIYSELNDSEKLALLNS